MILLLNFFPALFRISSLHPSTFEKSYRTSYIFRLKIYDSIPITNIAKASKPIIVTLEIIMPIVTLFTLGYMAKHKAIVKIHNKIDIVYNGKFMGVRLVVSTPEIASHTASLLVAIFFSHFNFH